MTLGLSRDARHVYTWDDGQTTTVLPSVTTILKSVDKSGPLMGWATRTTAEFAVDKAELIADMKRSGGVGPTVGWVSQQARQERDKAASLGSGVHALCDRIARGEDVITTPTERPFIDRFREFLIERAPRIVASEEMVANLTLGYAGTFDLVVELDGKRWMVDIKTGKGVYPEYGLQLAAYGKAEFVGRPGDATQHPMPKCSRFAVLHLRPEGWRLVPFSMTTASWDAFRAAVVVHGWLHGEAERVMEAA